jgi:hypothetical protein
MRRVGRPSTEQVARFIAWSWLLAGISVAVLQAGHAGFHERNELPPLLHWLRDASLAVPIAAFALIVAALAVTRARPADRRGRASLGTAGTWALLAAALYAALTVPFIQLHGLLFGAEVRAGVSPLAHALGEGVTVFQVALLLVPASLLAGVPWRDSRQPVPDPIARNDAPDPVPSAAPGDPAIHFAAAPVLEGAHR